MYFSYGSNMCADQMRKRCPRAVAVKPIRLEGFEFIINPRGVASLLPNQNEFAEGLLWEITEECETSLDHWEGVATGDYERHFLDLGEFDEDPVLVYIGTTQTKSFKVRPGYFEIILRGAKAAGLSDEYLQRLKAYSERCLPILG